MTAIVPSFISSTAIELIDGSIEVDQINSNTNDNVINGETNVEFVTFEIDTNSY